MVWHNYRYRLKCITRDRVSLFWTLLFPIILATLFNMAFSNISSGEEFKEIKIAVVDNAEYQQNIPFQTAIQAVSDTNMNTGEDRLFHVCYTSKEEGDRLLENNEIEGYIHLDNGIKMVVRDSGLNQTIIKSFIDDFKQTLSTMETIITEEPNAIQQGLLDNLRVRTNFIREVALGKSSPDIIVNYFYTLIAMACMYGSFWGLKEVTSIQADISPQGARVNVAPIHKFKAFVVFILAAVTVQLFEIFILLAYLILVLKISFGSQIGYIILTCVIGTITGVTFGASLAATVKGGEGTKIGLLIGSTMAMSFLAGMMYDKMKYIISSKAPLIGYINPVNLIADCFYSLYYYDTYTRFFIDIAILCGFIVLYSLVAYFMLRRQRYASL